MERVIFNAPERIIHWDISVAFFSC